MDTAASNLVPSSILNPSNSNNLAAQLARVQSQLQAKISECHNKDTRYEELMKENFELEVILKGYQKESEKSTVLITSLQSQQKRISDFLLKNYGDDWASMIDVTPNSPMVTKRVGGNQRGSILRQRRESFNPSLINSFSLEFAAEVADTTIENAEVEEENSELEIRRISEESLQKVNLLMSGILQNLQERKVDLESMQENALKEKSIATEKGEKFMELLESMKLS